MDDMGGILKRNINTLSQLQVSIEKKVNSDWIHYFHTASENVNAGRFLS
jgi:hypothetical protein